MQDWGDLIDAAEVERFVGRERELETFRQEVTRTLPGYLLFYITGQAGVGKSTLLKRYRAIAEAAGFLLTDTDEYQRDVPAVLGRFASQLSEQGYPLKKFDERYKTYRQKMDEIESDPEAPQGLAAMVGRTMVRATYIVGDLVPGLRKGLDYLPRETLENQASEWAEYLARKLTNKDEVALVREPTPILSKLFFEDLNELAQKCRVLLCFESFEATRQELQDWLLRLREYKPSLNIRIAIAGRDEPGAWWESLRKVTKIAHLDVFTEQEAQVFLDTYQITNDAVRKEILESSGRLPVLMEWMATIAVDSKNLDPTGSTYDVVERILRWIADPFLKRVALQSALPRFFNLDLLTFLLKDDSQQVDISSAFEWLQDMPFVQQHVDGWHYHEVVRRMMLHYQRQKSPQTYRQLHALLVDFYEAKRQELSSSQEKPWTHEQWRKDTLAYSYHLLAANPDSNWEQVISLFVVAIRQRRSFAREMVEVLDGNDVRDELTHEQRKTIQMLKQQLQTIEKGSLKDGLEMFEELARLTHLSPQARGYVYANRGVCWGGNRQWEKALNDFGEALHYIPEDAWTFTRRGDIYRMLGRYEEALVDFDQALALDEKYGWALALRGETYRAMKRYQEALADLDRAIALDEKDRLALAHRGQTYRQLGRYQEALADFDRAIALNEKSSWVLANRGETYQLMERYQEALADFDRAIALNEKNSKAIANRGRTYRAMKRYQEALTDLDRAIALNEESDRDWYSRALIHLCAGQMEAFHQDIQKAMSLAEAKVLKNPDDHWSGFHLALYMLAQSKSAEAETLYSRIIPLCTAPATLRDAIDDLSDLLTVQPSAQVAQPILGQLQARLAEVLSSSGTD